MSLVFWLVRIWIIKSLVLDQKTMRLTNNCHHRDPDRFVSLVLWLCPNLDHLAPENSDGLSDIVFLWLKSKEYYNDKPPHVSTDHHDVSPNHIKESSHQLRIKSFPGPVRPYSYGIRPSRSGWPGPCSSEGQDDEGKVAPTSFQGFGGSGGDTAVGTRRRLRVGPGRFHTIILIEHTTSSI